MKRFLSAIMLTFAAALLSAVTLPTGQEVAVKDVKEVNGKIMAVVLGTPTGFTTSIGTITAKANTQCEFYETGALRCIYSDDVIDVKMKCGDFKLISFWSSRPKNCVPFEFYEDGSLKSAQFSRLGKPFIQTNLGTLQAMTATKVMFFEDGSVESFSVYPSQKINLDNFKGSYPQQSTLAFYKSGSVKQLSSNAEELYVPFNIRIKKSSEIMFADNGNIISFTPAEQSAVKINGNTFLLARNKDFEIYDNGGVKKCTIECSNQDFMVDNVLFAYKTATETFSPYISYIPTAFLTLKWSEEENLILAMADRLNDQLDAFPVVGGYGTRLWSAKSIEYYNNGKMKCIDYVYPVRVGNRLRADVLKAKPKGFANIDASTPPEVNVKKNTTYEAWKSYFSNDGEIEYLVGVEVIESPESNFYDESKGGIFAIKGKEIVKSFYLNDITGNSELLFDDNGNLAAYTVIGQNDSIITKSLNK